MLPNTGGEGMGRLSAWKRAGFCARDHRLFLSVTQTPMTRNHLVCNRRTCPRHGLLLLCKFYRPQPAKLKELPGYDRTLTKLVNLRDRSAASDLLQNN
jgi:hypothetical protein